MASDSSSDSSPSQPNAPIDPNVKDTLRFLSDELMLHQFILRAQVKKRRKANMEFQLEEDATRARIRELKGRFLRELEANPSLRAGIEDGDEDSSEA